MLKSGGGNGNGNTRPRHLPWQLPLYFPPGPPYPHWGYCLEGEFVVRDDDGHEETITAGEAYYMPPGHAPRFLKDTRTLEFSPKADLDATLEVVQKNMERG
jgi:hypothetical protein